MIEFSEILLEIDIDADFVPVEAGVNVTVMSLLCPVGMLKDVGEMEKDVVSVPVAVMLVTVRVAGPLLDRVIVCCDDESEGMMPKSSEDADRVIGESWASKT